MASSMTPRRNATTKLRRKRRGAAPSRGSTSTRASPRPKPGHPAQKISAFSSMGKADFIFGSVLFPAAALDALRQHLDFEHRPATDHIQRLHVRPGEGKIL